MNVNPGFLPRHFVKCLARSYRALPHLMEIQEESSSIPNLARTKNGLAFLASEAEWALLIDSDMTWKPMSIIQLMKTAKEKKARIVSGITFMEQHRRIVPHAYEMIPDGAGGKVVAPYAVLPSYVEPFPVFAVGGACLLVHRDVYQDVYDLYKDKTGFYWQEDIYIPTAKANKMQGEDITFSKKVNEAGYQIWYDPQAPFPHLKKPDLITIADHVQTLQQAGITGLS